MASIFNKEEINQELPGIILASHGPVALGMVETVRMLTGETENIAAFSLEEGMDPEEYQKQLLEALEAYPEGSLIVVDVLGGTPSNSVIMISRQTERPVYCVAGMNVPMLMQATVNRNFQSGEELMNSVLEDLENGGVVSVTALIQKMKNK